jgi:hypothetical protein
MKVHWPLEDFFRSPDQASDPKGEGVLYSLRVDLEKLYGKESDFEGIPDSNSVLAIIGMLIGIDYVSQCYSSKKQSGEAFVDSLINLGGIDWDNAEALYQLKCALLRALSLSTTSDRKYFHKGTRFNFRFISDIRSTIIKIADVQESEVNYTVNIRGLKLCFTRMISQLEKICRDSEHKNHNTILNRVCRKGEERLLKT